MEGKIWGRGEEEFFLVVEKKGDKYLITANRYTHISTKHNVNTHVYITHFSIIVK